MTLLQTCVQDNILQKHQILKVKVINYHKHKTTGANIAQRYLLQIFKKKRYTDADNDSGLVILYAQLCKRFEIVQSCSRIVNQETFYYLC